MQVDVLKITTSTINALKRLRSSAKFTVEDFYPGAPTEELRTEAEQLVNRLLDRLTANLGKSPYKQFVLDEFCQSLDAFKQTDTEERERLCAYLEEIMDIIGIKSSDGLLNDWLYGFDPSSANLPPRA